MYQCYELLPGGMVHLLVVDPEKLVKAHTQQCELVKEEMKLKPVIKLKKMLSQLKMMPG